VDKKLIQKNLSFKDPIQKDHYKEYEKEGKWYVEALASTDEIDSENFRMTKPALEDLVRDARVLTTVLHNHLKDEEIGAIEEAKVVLVQKEPEIWGAWLKILISKTVPDIWQKIKEKVLNKLSIKGIAESRSTQDKRRGIIEEAIAYEGAEVSIVSVPTLKTAEILSYYVEKMKRNGGGLPMEIKDLEKIGLGPAKEAIRDLLGLTAEDEQWGNIEKIMDLIEVEVKKDEGGGEEEVENDLKSQIGKVLTALKNLRGQVEGGTQKLVDDVIALVEAVETKYPAPQQKSKEEEDAVRIAAEKAIKDAKDAALQKSREIAAGMTEGLEKQIADLPEADRGPLTAVLNTLKELSKAVEKGEGEKKEKGKGGEEKKKSTDEVVNAIEETLQEVQKSVKDAASQIESDRLVEMAEQVVTMKTEVEKLSQVMSKLPIRKGLTREGERRDQEKKPFTEDKAYQDLEPRDKLGFLFGKLEGK